MLGNYYYYYYSQFHLNRHACAHGLCDSNALFAEMNAAQRQMEYASWPKQLNMYQCTQKRLFNELI